MGAATGARQELPAANVLGVAVHAVDIPGAVARIEAGIRARCGGYVCVTGMHGVMEAQRDERLRAALDGAYLNVPDGMPTVWVGRLQGHRSMRRVFGPDLMAELCRRSVAAGTRHYFYGGGPGVAEELAAALQARFPGLQVAGTECPPFRGLEAEEIADLQARIARLRPDVFWVGLSTPKQEQFMSALAGSLDVGVSIGVGAAFDYHTGRLRDAPAWVKESGLQWAHRLWQEPRRLWRRYTRNIPSFVFLLLLQLSGIRTYGRART
jgi:N-acetylglucosaminyldiphosphoundecaprenol N-acetyl-beta-D-mannosaminyltransferase